MSNRQYRNANAAPAREARRPSRRPHRRDWIEGTLVELDADRRLLTIRVTGSGRPALAEGSEVSLDVAGARIRAADGDGDGRPGLTDLFPGDRVHVVLHRGDALVAARVRLASPPGPKGGLRRLWQPLSCPSPATRS